jgi:Na+-transporting NADH:ubiquinone oxidoreductase subunit A
MAAINIKKGLNLPITGSPEAVIDESKKVTKVALLGNDYFGLKPTLEVSVGEEVKLGQLLFTDKKMPAVKFTSPASGRVVEINRGEKRVFLSIVIEIEGKDEVTFKSYSESELLTLNKETIKEQLIESGLWTAIRERPFGRVANPDTNPSSIFVTAIDSNPLALSVEKILEGNETDFKNGLRILSKLTDGQIYLCKDEEEKIPEVQLHNLTVQEFSGVHPKGLPGTHIHFLDPAGRAKKVWYLGAQDVLAIAHLFTKGKLKTDRIISLAGPSVQKPRYVKTRIGASLHELCAGEITDGENRLISGSVLFGRIATTEEGYLGRYDQQISVISEHSTRNFLGWITPDPRLYSLKNVMLSSLTPKKMFNFNTALNGGKRAIVPTGSYEQVMPLDILPTYLLRALAIDDVEEAEKLGCLELDEEDLALCTFVCPSKVNHGENLRRNLMLIDREG